MREKRSPLFGFVGNLMYFCKLLCPQVSADWKNQDKNDKRYDFKGNQKSILGLLCFKRPSDRAFCTDGRKE